MATRQFSFTFTVGIALAIVGTIILGQSSIGLSLIALGAVIAGLAIFTRYFQSQGQQTLPSQTRLHLQNSPAK
ncbi:MAG: hypothetical protein AAGA91_12690 [Pseudomonadota bacterium]